MMKDFRSTYFISIVRIINNSHQFVKLEIILCSPTFTEDFNQAHVSDMQHIHLWLGKAMTSILFVIH